jgi:predicted transcriptional regulator
MVRKSKLEMRVDILEILAHGPMKLTKLMHKVDLSENVLKQHLSFLVQQDLVEEQNLGKDAIFYVVTRRGLKVLYIVVPMIGEARKSQALIY